MTITLCGTPISNYYNKVKLVLLEKGIPFDEQLVGTGSTDEAVLAASPLAKVPFLRVDGQALCESQVIADYLEAAYPSPPLVPADPFAAAKVRELVAFVELHVELTARELYRAAFFGGTALSDSAKERVHKQLTRHIGGLKRLVKFDPYIAGGTFTVADCAAWASLSVVAMATKAVYGSDLLADGGLDVKPYLRLIGERPSTQRVVADRKAEQARLAAARG